MIKKYLFAGQQNYYTGDAVSATPTALGSSVCSPSGDSSSMGSPRGLIQKSPICTSAA